MTLCRVSLNILRKTRKLRYWFATTSEPVKVVFQQLLERFPGEVKLLHARFNAQDRNCIEKEITSSTPPRLLVATQAVEVLLDLNYDCGFIEPAPADALVQI